MNRLVPRRAIAIPALFSLFGAIGAAQLTDRNISTNTAKAGIAKTLSDEIGFGTSDADHRGATPTSCSPTAATDMAIATSQYDTSLYLIACDPFRAIRRGRQIFQRKFTRAQGQGPAFEDAAGSLNENGTPGGLGDPHHASGFTDSCAACHGRPKGSAGASGVTFTRPDSRDSPHLFGLGLKEMLADEITQDLRAIRTSAISQAQSSHKSVTLSLDSKGINYGKITASPSGTVDTSQVQGVNPDLRIRQIFFDGELFSIRESIIATFKFELGLQATDPLIAAVRAGTKQTTPSGLVLDPAADQFLGPPPCAENTVCDASNMVNEFPASLVDMEEFYLLNYFSPGTYEQKNNTIRDGVQAFNHMGCGTCHIQNLQINRDRRVADVSTVYDPLHGGFNSMFASVTPFFTTNAGGVKTPSMKPYLVQNIFTDFKRHDLGPNYHENLFDGGTTTMFLTTALWGIGSTAPYGHDGRSINLHEAILRHGGEAQAARDAYAKAGEGEQQKVLDMLNALVLFPPDDTASSLKGESPTTAGYPQNGHGAISLGALFNNKSDPE